MDSTYILRILYELNVLPLALQITNICGNVLVNNYCEIDLVIINPKSNEFWKFILFFLRQNVNLASDQNFIFPYGNYTSKLSLKKLFNMYLELCLYYHCMLWDNGEETPNWYLLGSFISVIKRHCVVFNLAVRTVGSFNGPCLVLYMYSVYDDYNLMP